MSKKVKIFQKLIARLFTAVFLFVVISSSIAPAFPVQAADDVSGNEAEGEDYTDWEDALSDDEYKENLADKITRLWVANWTNYVGHTQEGIDKIIEIIGDSYDYTVDTADNLYHLLLPYSKDYVNNLDPTSISELTYGRPKNGTNNVKLINDIARDLGDNLDNLKPNADNIFTSLPEDKYKNSNLIHYDFMPDFTYISKTDIQFSYNVSINPALTPNAGKMFISFFSPDYSYNGRQNNYYCSFKSVDTYMFKYTLNSVGFSWSICTPSDGYNAVAKSYNILNPIGVYINGSSISKSQPENYGGIYAYPTMNSNKSHYAILYGDCYFIDTVHLINGLKHLYRWDQDTLTMYDLGGLSDTANDVNVYNSEGTSVTYNMEVNVLNTVDYDTYLDLVNDALEEVTNNTSVTNSLLIELINQIRDQNNNYVGDDIYDYINDLILNLQDTKDKHIEIPDISPDLGGIADGLTALLNFLASIIRAIGNIVSSLLDGLFHLFVPSDDDWNDITVEFDKLTSPLSWIGEFIGEASSSVSLLLFGRNTVEFAAVEDEVQTAEVDLYESGSPSEHSQSHHTGIETGIVYDPDCGAPKIPVHFSNSSSDYFRNIEDAYIIDLCWYAPFKPVGDIIVVAFCWILFIWRVLHDLPGIINGASGITDNGAYTDDQEFRKVSTWNGIFHR